jgi:hypothetical protein
MTTTKPNQPKIWTTRAGKDNSQWNLFKQECAISVHIPTLKAKGRQSDIDYFKNEINIDDIIIVIDPLKKYVYGIGVIKSNYLSPTDLNNPSHHHTNTHGFKDARLTDWLTVDELKDPSFTFFSNGTGNLINSLSIQEYNCIRKAYLKEKNINLPSLTPPIYSQEKLKLVLEKISKNRNVILYGAAGTGKTYTAKYF